MNPLSVLLLAATVIYGRVAVDYCSPKLCGSSKHVACGNNGAFLFSCPKNAKMVNITDDLKNYIVALHNGKRNTVAGGNAENHDPACRMAVMEWDNEMSFLASYTVKQCEFDNDNCRNTNTCLRSGQNMASILFNGTSDYKLEFRTSVDSWYSDIRKSKKEYMQNYPRDGPDISPFAVLVAEKNTRVGCAAITYKAYNRIDTFFLMTCNYAVIPIVDHPIYASCSASASGCTTGTAPGYNALCSRYETIDPNDLNC